MEHIDQQELMRSSMQEMPDEMRVAVLAGMLGFKEEGGVVDRSVAKLPRTKKEILADEATIQNFISSFPMLTQPPYLYSFAADYLPMLLNTYISAKNAQEVRTLVPALMQTASMPAFVRYLRLNGVEEFINDHLRIFATFDVDSWTTTEPITLDTIVEWHDTAIFFSSLLGWQSTLLKIACRLLNTDLPSLDVSKVSLLFNTLDHVRLDLPNIIARINAVTGPAGAVQPEGNTGKKNCLLVFEALKKSILFDAGLIKLLNQQVGLLGLSHDGHCPWLDCEGESLDGACVKGKLSACSKCHSVRYCGPKHQRAHWKTHKVQCFAPKW
ncbi:hypothetical protein BDY24DRAFT_374114 [Mrakia frigida]|uniref:zinc finger MYND domain-containing protein n=1 Tax=Mrakia frigida TaxID=29902 RepID=UPI003FCC0F08